VLPLHNPQVSRWGALLPLPAAMLATRHGADLRTRLLVLFVTAAIALVAVAPDLELEPAACRLIQRVRALALLARLAGTSSLLTTAGVSALPPAASLRATGASIIELTCSRLC